MSEVWPRRPVAVEDVPWEGWAEGVRFGGRTRTLANTRDGSGLRIGVVIEELLPGKQSCPFHYHLREEEHILMLAGEVMLRLGADEHRFRAGEFVSFPAAVPHGHCLVNDTDAPARYLVIGDSDSHDVCIYPDSDKIALRGATRAIYRLGQRAEYWDGERADELP
jgi:uncharacterized cupin superfamily protein